MLPAVGLALSLGLPTAAHADEFYVDPNRGSAAGAGTMDDPWGTLEEVATAGLLGGSGPVQGGDTVLLADGYHGELVISRVTNATPITIEAAPGATPRIRRVLLRNSGGWTLRRLSISPSYAPIYERITLVDLDGAETANVTVEDCELFSVRDSSGWSAEDWVDNACNGFAVDGPDVIIRRNYLLNVDFGISVGGERALISRNVIENFSGDGLRGLGDGGVFEYNVVKNCYDVDDNHDDGFQSWSVGDGGVGTGEVRDIVLRGNVIINYEDPAQPLRGSLQGIGCFDGFFVDWVIENNVIITDHWHGITLLGARGARILNNTVIDPNGERPGPPWIQVGAHKDGTPSTDIVVRNNLVTDLNIDDGATIVVDGNIEMSDLDAFFVDVAGNDLHLVDDAPAIDMGLPDLAPWIDIEGIPRPQGLGFDVGAYEWHTPDVTPIEDAGMLPGRDGGVPPPGLDGGASGADAGPGGVDDGGCGCRAHSGRSIDLVPLLLLAIIGLILHRRRRR